MQSLWKGGGKTGRLLVDLNAKENDFFVFIAKWRALQRDRQNEQLPGGRNRKRAPKKMANYTNYTRDQPVFFDSSVHCHAQALQLRSQYSTLSPPLWIVLFPFIKKTLCIRHCKINVYGLLIKVHRVQCVFWRCGRWRLQR